MCLRSSTKLKSEMVANGAAVSSSSYKQYARRPLVSSSCGYVKTFFVMLYSHLCVTMLCINVAFDLFVLGLPAYLVLYPVSKSLFRKYMTALINYTTPIVVNLPMILSGSTLHCDSMDYYMNKVKQQNSLMLANHGSRIDWMIGMYVGYIKTATSPRSRVGFVCERVIQLMPLIGWYRRLVCEDVFVDRSFKIDSINIALNLNDFHKTQTERMLYLSPEGVVVDYGERDQKYIANCREFCKEQGYEPFDYVLTPRYKGQTILVDHIKGGGTITSICTAFVKNGKLLNCEMSSEERSIPDIYTLCAGIAGEPVHMYINLEEMHFKSTDQPEVIKKIMMEDYKRKDDKLREWHKLLKAGKKKEFEKQFETFVPHFWDAQLHQVAHALSIFALCHFLGVTYGFLKFACCVFAAVAGGHTLGWFMNATSMESVPFETAIKGVMMVLFPSTRKHKEDRKIVLEKKDE